MRALQQEGACVETLVDRDYTDLLPERPTRDRPKVDQPQASEVGSSGLDCCPFDECHDVRVDHVGMSCDHAVWEAGVNLQRGILD
jgi:hypothetical protein